MKTRIEFPYIANEIEHLYISMQDGTRLAARLWLPECDDGLLVPAILEYLPYRKRDGTAVRDALTHPWFAGHGYACIRVDMRGNGESEGLMHDEYLAQELADGLEVIDWLCAQPWCSGNVGMMGISWGGFNSLQIAALQPKALKAIITLCSTDDRYSDDIHYKGGNMLLENVGWAATMLNFSAAVPDPLLVDDWRERWLDRLNNMPLLLEKWLSHQTRDSYWQHGSICEDYTAIKAAVLAVGGWGDAYKNTVPRMMENLQCPRKAVIGPWAHKYPHFAVPDPAIGFLQEALRWWDYWLKDIDNAIMDEPKYTAYIQDAVAPQSSYAQRSGDWVQMNSWTESKASSKTLYLSNADLSADKAKTPSTQKINSPLSTGTAGGEYCAIWLGPESPIDQRRDDAHSLCFTSSVLSEELALLGAPRVHLKLSSDQDCGQICVRLNDVSPTGAVTRITYGCLNLQMSNSLEHPEKLIPNHVYDITLLLDDTGYKVPAGHQLRVAISSAYFPLIWPTHKFTSLTLHGVDNFIELPQFIGEKIPSPFEPPEGAAAEPLEYLSPSSNSRTITEDVASGEVCTKIEDDFGHIHFLNHGLKVHQTCHEEYRIKPYDPQSAIADISWHYQAGRGNWQVSVVSKLKLNCDADYFYIQASQQANEGEEVVHQREWQRKIKRQSV
ncbi:MAG: putative CocE/NonD family hydrolase [Oceanospirillaceae bacterium]|jgi:putative CocE/NonD family hydrolase